jgi:Lipocalin-like domain
LRPDPGGDAKRFIGTWRLVSLTGQDGAPEPVRGAHPTGMIHYDTTGHMSVQIVPDRRRPPFSGLYPTPDEALGAVAGYTAYFGTYSIDEAARTVTHHREGNINPAGLGDFVRQYEFLAEDKVAFTPAESGNPIGRLVWERIKAE